MLADFRRIVRGDDGKTDGRKKEGECFHLIAAAARQLQREEQQPLHGNQGSEAQNGGGHGFRLQMGDKLECGKELEECQEEQRQRRGAHVLRLGARGKLILHLLLRDRREDHLHAAKVDAVAVLDGAERRLFAVDHHRAAGADVRDGPAAVVKARQYGMAAGDGGEVHHNVTAAAAADDVLPVGDRKLVAVRHDEPRPRFRLAAEFQQRSGAAPEDQNAQQRRDVAPERTEDLGQFCTAGLKIIKNCGKQLLHSVTSHLVQMFFVATL